jgi:hypothetical protein
MAHFSPLYRTFYFTQSCRTRELAAPLHLAP